jgi:hypothetical protein
MQEEPQNQTPPIPSVTPTPVTTGSPAGTSEPKGKKNPIAVVIVIVVIIAIIVLGWFLLKSLSGKTPSVSTQPPASQDVAPVNNASDIEKLKAEVEATNLDELSQDLDKNDQDSADF